jgi:heme exporter protein D
VADLDKLCSFGGMDAPYAAFVWESFVPSKVKFFGCLLVSRIQSRATLLKENIILLRTNLWLDG